MTMTPRWIAARLADADACKTKMPWECGLRREAFATKRRLRAALDTAVTTPHAAA